MQVKALCQACTVGSNNVTVNSKQSGAMQSQIARHQVMLRLKCLKTLGTATDLLTMSKKSVVAERHEF